MYPHHPMSRDLVEVLYDEEQISRRVRQLGDQISADYSGRNLVLIGIMRGALMFLADLSRCITIPHTMDFISASSYRGTTQSSGFVRIYRDVELDLSESHVIVVDDIYDSGRTLHTVVDLFRMRGARSVEVATFLYKEVADRAKEVHVEYPGFRIPNAFVVGYGLDYGELYRNLPVIGVLNPSVYAGK